MARENENEQNIEDDQEEEEQMQVDESNNVPDDLESSFTAADSIPTSGHSRLLNALESEETLVQLVNAHKNKKEEFDLDEVLPILTQDEQVAMWSRLKAFVEIAIKDIGTVNFDKHLDLLNGIALMCKLCLGLDEVLESPAPAMKQTIQIFSENLLHVGSQVGDTLSKCVENWYLCSLEDREDYVPNSLRFLISKTLADKGGTKSDVKRVWALHDILLSMRLEESNMGELLLQCFCSPLYLSVPEGVKFLTSTFSLSLPFLQDIFKQIKISLTKLNSKQSFKLGEVYMKALVQSGGTFRTCLEKNLQQKIMDEGILVNRSKFPGLSKNIISFLHYFHDNKQNPDLMSLICKLYAPFLWRYIKCNNENIRLNAIEVFLSAYPIEDTTNNKEVRDQELNKQNALLCKLLLDDVVEVRATVVLGVGRILSNYWLLLSSQTIHSFMDPIIKELSCESVAKVRVRVYQCIKIILGTAYSNVYMKDVLPRLKQGLHDVNEAVRIAFVDVLLQVKTIKIIKILDICPLETILAQLEVDRATVSRGLVKLLHPSMFPQESTTEELLDRAVRLQQLNRPAARKFYSLVTTMVDMTKLLDLMYGTLDSVRKYIKLKANSSKNSAGKENKRKKRLYDKTVLDESAEQFDNTTASSVSSLASSSSVLSARDDNVSESESNLQQPAHIYDDINLVGGMLDAVCILWHNLQPQLAEDSNKEYRLYLEQKVAKSIVILFKQYRDTSISSTIVYLASFLSHSSASHVASYSLSQLKKSSKFECHAEALVHWRRGDEVLERLQEWIQGHLDMPTPVPHSGVHFREPDIDKHTKLILLKKNSQEVKDLSKTTEKVMYVIEDKLGNAEIGLQKIEDLATVFGLHLNLVVTLGLHNKDLIEQMEQIVSWADVQLIPVVFRDEECSMSSIRLAEDCLRKILVSLDGVLQTGQVDEKFIIQLLDFLKRLTAYLPFANEILELEIETAGLSYTKQYRDVYEDQVPITFTNFLRAFTQEGHRLEAEQANSIKTRLTKFVGCYRKFSKLDPTTDTTCKDLVEAFALALLQSAKKEVESTEENMMINRFSDLHPQRTKVQVLHYRSCQILAEIIMENEYISEALFQSMHEFLEEGNLILMYTILCIGANLESDNRQNILDKVSSHLDSLQQVTDEEETPEYLDTCRRVISMFNQI